MWSWGYTGRVFVRELGGGAVGVQGRRGLSVRLSWSLITEALGLCNLGGFNKQSTQDDS